MDTANTRPILIVEDVDEISSQMLQILNRGGHRVICADDAEQAIRMAEQDQPAMILTDMELPSFDLLMKLLREHERFSKMVVAIVDMNEPQLADTTIKVLPDFKAIDTLMAALPNQSQTH